MMNQSLDKDIPVIDPPAGKEKTSFGNALERPLKQKITENKQ